MCVLIVFTDTFMCSAISETEAPFTSARNTSCSRSDSRVCGGPVGVDNLAAAISEERHTIEDVLEPYLIQQGYIMRTPRGRVVTRHAYLHFGLNIPSRMGEMPGAEQFVADEDN